MAVGQRRAALQVGLDLGGVLAKGALNLLVEVRIPVVDVVDILVLPERTPPAERLAARLPAGRRAQGAGVVGGAR